MDNAEMILNKSRSLVMSKFIPIDSDSDSLVDILDGKKFNDMLKNRMYNHILYKAQKMKNADGLYTCKISRKEICNKVIKNTAYQSRNDIEQILSDIQHTSIAYWDRKDNKDIKVNYNLLVGYKYVLQDDEWELKIPDEIYYYLTSYLTDKNEKQQLEDKLNNQRNSLTEIEIKNIEAKLEEKRKNYAPIDLAIMDTFSSNYTLNLYEVLRLWSRTNKEITHTFSLEEIRYVLGIENNKYERYSNLKQRVLNICIDELENKANMIVKIKEIGPGRKTTHIVFTILDRENKIYFRNRKLNELKSISLELLSDNIKVEIQNEILDLENNSQHFTQKVFEKKFLEVRDKINIQLAKIKELDDLFDKATFRKFRLEYKFLDLDDDKIKIMILDCISKAFTGTNSIKGKIYANNYKYFIKILNQALEIKSSNNKGKQEGKFYKETDKSAKDNLSDEKDNNVSEEHNDSILNSIPEKSIEESNKDDSKDTDRKLLINVKDTLKSCMDKTAFDCWFDQSLNSMYIENNTLIIDYKVDIAAQIIKERYSVILNDILSSFNINSYKLENNKNK